VSPTFTNCHACDRGGNGNAKDKCSCGWRVTAESVLGCFLGEPIVGEPRKRPKLSRSAVRYQRFLNWRDVTSGTFREFLEVDR